MNVVAIIPVTLEPTGPEPNVLTPLEGQPVLGHVIDRVAQVEKLEGIIVTTSDEPRDEAIADYCATRGTTCLKGPRDDVLGRLLAAVKGAGAKGGVMVDGKSPLIDPAIVDQIVNLLQMTDGMLDWVGNTASATYPQGMQIDGFTAAALEEAGVRCAEPEQRRLGPAFLWQNSRLYRLLSVSAPVELARPQTKLRIDDAEDLLRMEAVLRHFGSRRDFALADILAYLDATPAT